jgi:hypothetical protein
MYGLTISEESKISAKVAKSNTLWALAGNLDTKGTAEVVIGILEQMDPDCASTIGEEVMQAYCDGMGRNLSGDNYSVSLMDAVEQAAQEYSDNGMCEIYGREDGLWKYHEEVNLHR